jgi:putative membrane protein
MNLTLIRPLYIKIFLSIIYLVGVVGMYYSPSDFIPLTPYNLSLTCLILLSFYPYKEKDFIRYVLFLFSAGFAVEMLGVQTGKIFGAYHYGYALGYKLKHVPIIIGVNWVMLTLATQSIAQKFSSKLYISAAIGAALMVSLDILIEQVASKYQFWHWHNNEIPLQNYVAWFIISFFFHGLGSVMKFEKENKIATFIFALQFVFFALLNLINFLEK